MSDLWRIVDIERGRHQYVKAINGFEPTDRGVILHGVTNKGNAIDICLQVCTPEIIRLFMSPVDEKEREASLLDIKQDWEVTPFDLVTTDETIQVVTARIVFEVSKFPWRWTILDKSSRMIACSEVSDLDVTKERRSLPLGFFEEDGQIKGVNETIRLHSDEQYFGLGEKFVDLNRRHQNIRCWNVDALGVGTEEAYKNVPFLMSSKGFGLFLNTTFLSVWELGSRSNLASTIMTADPKLDLYVIYGPDLKAILARYTEITGRAPLPPKKSFGIQASVSWGNIEPASRRFRDSGIPIDKLRVISPMHGWPDWGEMIPAIQDTVAFMQSQYIDGTLYTTPYLPVGSRMEEEARQRGYLVRREDGSVYEDNLGPKPNGHKGVPVSNFAAIERSDAWRESYKVRHRLPCTIVDFTNPEAVEWWKGTLRQLVSLGFTEIGMADHGEDAPLDGVYANGRGGAENHNIYPLLYNRANYDGLKALGQDRPWINARSGYTGMQKYGFYWSGRPNCTYHDLGANIRAGLSLGLSGVPFWASDTGGNWGTPGADLYIRWAQFSMFCSHVFLHGGGDDRLPWRYGEEAAEVFRKYARLRYRLLPYIYSYAYQAAQQSLPLMRALPLEFDGDQLAGQFDLQYMFGHEILVAPVYTESGRRPVYLPRGGWIDYWTKEHHQGVTVLDYTAPLDRLPLFVRENAIIPIGPEIEWIDEAPFKEITLEIWLEDQAAFKLFDEPGITHIAAQRTDEGFTIDISPSSRAYTAHFNNVISPGSVQFNGQELEKRKNRRDFEKKSFGWWLDSDNTVWVKFSTNNEPVHLALTEKGSGDELVA